MFCIVQNMLAGIGDRCIMQRAPIKITLFLVFLPCIPGKVSYILKLYAVTSRPQDKKRSAGTGRWKERLERK